MKDCTKAIMSIYNAWCLVLIALLGILQVYPDGITIPLVIYLVTLGISGFNLYRYYIKKSINEFCEPIK